MLNSVRTSTTATLEGLEQLKERLHSLYVEQLCERPRPAGRSPESWDNILSTFRVSFENKLATLSTIESVWKFGERCLKREHLREVFRHFGFEDVCNTSISQSIQAASLYPLEESERDLFVGSVDLSILLEPVDSVTPACEPRSSEPRAFDCELKPCESVIDLD